MLFFPEHVENKTAVIYQDRSYSFYSLSYQADLIKNLISPYLKDDNKRVGILLNNTPLFASSILAINKLTASCVLFSTKFKLFEIEKYLYDVQPLLIIESGIIEVDKFSINKELIYSSYSEDFGKIKIWLFNYEQTRKEREYDDNIFTYQFTSGVTGQSKIVPRTYNNLWHEVISYEKTIGVKKQDIVICPSPLFHAYGLVNGLLVPLYCGMTIVLMEQFVPADFLYYVKKYQATISICVPYMYHILNECHVDSFNPLSSLRICFTAGGKLSLDIARAFYKKFGLTILQQYGSTETGTICIMPSSANQLSNINSVGFPIEGTTIKIIDDEGKDAHFGTEGEILIKSNGSSSGYLIQDEFCNKKFRNGWYHTNDLGWINDKGELVLAGRSSLFVNVVGLKVDPIEVEEVIMQIPAISDCVVLGVPHKDYGEVLKAAVVLNKPIPVNLILNHCRKRLANYKVPREIFFVDEIPKSPTGKILRKYIIDQIS